MPFPEAPRVVFEKNPLDQVICQLRFPPILRIDTETPSDFQDEIQGAFPLYSATSEFQFTFPAEITDLPPGVSPTITQPSGWMNHQFASEDELWKVSLTRQFIALTSNRYGRWEEFKEKLNIPLNALLKSYSPSGFSRVGLRYIDVIRRSALGLSNVGWNSLLKPYVLGLLSSDVGDHIQGYEGRYEIGLSDNSSMVRIITRLVESSESGEVCYMIDSDFFHVGKINTEAALEKLDYFKAHGSRLFQWCITERLYEAMKPQIL